MKDKLKIKVIAGFVMATLLVLAVSFFTISNFLQLQESVEKLSLPDQKLLLISKLLTDISETETLVRSYALTGQAKYLDQYYQNNETIEGNIDSLKDLTSKNRMQYAKIDSIESLWSNKMKNFDTYIKLKHKEKLRDFSSRAISKVSKQAMDSVKKTRTTKSIDVSEKLQVPEVKPNEEQEPVIEKDKEKNVFNLIAGLFSKKKNNDNEDRQQETEAASEEPVDTLKTITQEHVRYDTVVVQEDASKVIDKVVTILEDIKAQENRFTAMMTRREYDLLLDDIMIMENIRTMIQDLQMEEIQQASEQTSQSRKFAEKSINVIFIVGITGLIVSALFMYLILSDITKSNFYKRRLEKAKRKAEKLARVKEEFLANMSHEIRTPLNTILGFTQQLLLTPLQQKQHYYLQAVKNSSSHLLNTVNDILDFSKIEAGKLSINYLPMKLSVELAEIYQNFKLKAEEKGIDLILETEFNSDEIIIADAFRIKQILFNLISNAIKFTEVGHVKIKTRLEALNEEHFSMQISVIDTGTGIPTHKLKNIFRGFEQADSSITRKYGGTGLGLTISQRLAKLMDGELTVKSKEGEGSEFTLQMPVNKGDLDTYQKQDIPVAIDASLLKDRKVLVADDDEYNILLFHTILKKWDVAVDLAENGLEAYQKLQDNAYEIVLTDVNMPEMSGIDLVNKTRQHLPAYQNIPFLCITANVFHDKSYQCFDGFVLKPFTEEDLFIKMVSALGLEIDAMPEDGSAAAQQPDQPLEIDHVDTGISLTELEKFADGDWQMVKGMAQELISNNRLSMLQINNAMAKNDWDTVASIAHKMRPSFAHINALQVVDHLHKLEHEKDSLKQAELKSIVLQLNQLTSEAFTLLEAKIDKPGTVNA